VLEAFAIEYYGSSPSVPPQIIVPPDAGDTSALAGFLSERRGSQVEVRAPVRGEKRRLQQLATENARLALESEALQTERRRLRRVEALEELREALNLESLPLRIECYDVSNIQGEATVGAMVVFQDAVPKKAHYRKFGVRTLDGQGRLRGARRGDRAPVRTAPGRDPRRPPRRVLRGDAEPRGDRRRQGPAGGGAGGNAGLRPAASGRDLAREAGRGGLRARGG
jgi:excinuclease ABC subunit C